MRRVGVIYAITLFILALLAGSLIFISHLKFSSNFSEILVLVSAGIMIGLIYNICSTSGLAPSLEQNIAPNPLLGLDAGYAKLTDNIPAALAIHDASGKITYCSPYIEVLTGYSRKEVYHNVENFFEVVCHTEDNDKVKRALKVSQFGEAFQFRFRFHHKSGPLMWAETRMVPMSDDSGDISSMLSITIDVTSSVRYQQRVEEHNQDLQDFAYMISHDLKGPLVTVRGMLTALIEDYSVQLQKDGSELLQHALKATDRLDLLVKGVLEYSQLTNMQDRLEEVDAQQLLQEIISEKQAQLSEIQALVKVNELPRLIADKTMLYQIFANIIGNAIKYRSPERALELTISAKLGAAQTCDISFVDNGRGIPASKIGDVFRPFQRAHEKSIEGAGIGLACVKKLVEKMGGSVAAESTENYGSNFVVTLRAA